MTVGRNIKHMRKTRALSLDDVAKRAGISKQGLWQIEEGKSSPTFVTLEKIAHAFNVSVSELIREDAETLAAV
jgi:transcriptional regulator with XRE-family HTH domain